MMSKTLLPILFGTVLLVAFWLNALRAREMANDSAKATCMKQNLQFLDGSVALVHWQIRARDNKHATSPRCSYWQGDKLLPENRALIRGMLVILRPIHLAARLMTQRRLSMRRTYQFEYSDDGNGRCKGVIIIAANRVESIVLAP